MENERSLKFHKFYVVFIVIRGVIGIISTLTGCFNVIPMLDEYIFYSDILMYKNFLIVYAVVNIIEAMVGFFTCSKLKSFSYNGLQLNKLYLLLAVITALFRGFDNYNEETMLSYGVGVAAAIGTALLIALPILIYYNKRKHLFNDGINTEAAE